MPAHRLRLALRATVVFLTAALILPVVPASAAPRIQPIAPVVSATLRLRPTGPAVAALGGNTSSTVVTESSIAFSMVGFTVPARHELSFRTSVDGTTWGPWRHPEDEVETEDTPDAGSAEMRRAVRRAPGTRRMTEPVWVDEARWLETRVAGPRPARVVPVAHVIDATGLARTLAQRVADRVVAVWRGTTATSVAEAAVSRPQIITRRQWGANESWRGRPTYARTLKAAVIHHTAGSNSYSRSEAAAVVRGTYWYHTHNRGWNDLGYNFLVDRFGRIYEGRAGGTARNVIGAHAGGFNTGTFGVSLMGEFSNRQPSDAMRAAVARLVAWKFDLNRIRARTTVRLTSAGSTKYAAGQVVRLNTISGHRDVSATACPGTRVYNTLGWVRRRVAALQGGTTSEPPPPDGGDGGGTTDPAPPTTGPRILVADNDSRHNAGWLHGRTVGGWIFVWSTRQERNTSQVRFTMRPPDALEEPARTEYYVPYDFGWINTNALRDGEHTVVAAVTRADGTIRSHRATFTVDNHAPGVAWAWRVNSGGGRVTDPQGRVWQGDLGADGGSSASVSGVTVAGTRFQSLHRDERYGMRAYRVRVPVDGSYRVRLHLSEIYWSEPGRRVFSAWAEGARVLDDYDLVAAVGARRARIVETSVVVDDGVLDLSFWARRDHAKLAGFEVIRGGSGIPAPAVTTPQPPAPSLQLMVSTSRWRSSAKPLASATLTGPVAIFVNGIDAASAVAFHVNDPAAGRSPFHTERYTPWDMAGTSSNGEAGLWDPRHLGHGDHSVTAVVTTPSGKRSVTATFHVDP